MTVLHLHDSMGIYGGAEVYISELQPLLKKNNCNSHWIAINREGALFKFEEAGKNNPVFGDETGVIAILKKFINENGVDIINIHNIFHAEIVRFCLDTGPVIKFSHSPVMVCPGRDKFWSRSETICEIKYGLHCFWHIYSQRCANRNPMSVIKSYENVEFEIKEASLRYERIMVMSEYMRSGLLECGVAPENILVTPHFTEVVDKILIYTSPPAEFRLLFIGRLISSKGPHIMIRSLSKLLKARADLFLDIVGDGIMRNELTSIVAEEGLQNKIIFHGWKKREEIPGILSRCYALIFPSIYPEAFGITGIEAMMHAKPVVAFNVGGVSSWCEHDHTGFCLDKQDTEGIERSVQLLISDRELYERMSVAARETALQKFTPEKHIKVLMDLYKECLERPLKSNVN